MTASHGDDDREVVEQVTFKTQQAPGMPEGWVQGANGAKISPQFMRLVNQAANGQLPDIGDVPEEDPAVVELARHLSPLHLPEWRNPAGRKLADATVVPSVPLAVRIAKMLVLSLGYRRQPELETERWYPTPGNSTGAHDVGLWVKRDEHGEFPDPDPESFYNIDDIKISQLDTGEYVAAHPRGIAFQAKSKIDAHAGLVDVIRKRINDAKAKA